MKHLIPLVLAAFVVAGCGGKPVPPDFPSKLTPTTVTLVKDGKPIDGAAVSLMTETPTPYLVSAVTNSNGLAALETQINVYTRPGVPAGTYKVLISKEIQPQTSEPSPQEEIELGAEKVKAIRAQIAKEKEEIRKTNPVLPEWNNIKKTPFTLTVPDSGGTFTIDVANP